jgi:hypothetical protein
MARTTGRKGRVYIAIVAGAQASMLPFTAKWSLSASTDQLDVTAMDDDNKVYVSDVPDASGDFSGFYDDATDQTYTAATDGIARKFYLYPSKDSAGTYWFGTVNVDFNIDGGVGQGVNMRGKWNAATTIQKVSA